MPGPKKPKQYPPIPGTCTVCAVYKPDLRSHMYLEHPQAMPYKCEHCDKSFKREDIMETHVDTAHPKTRKHKCTVCDRKFFKAPDLKRHITRMHKGSAKKIIKAGKHKCATCGKTFRDLGELHKHIKSHVEIQTYKCQVCDRSFRSQRAFHNHKKVHKGNKNKNFQCKTCGKIFLHGSHLMEHSLVHTKTNGSTMACDQCNDKFNTQESLNYHRQYHHEPTIKYECADCGDVFDTKGDLLKHVCMKTMQIEAEKHHSSRHHGSKFPQFTKLKHQEKGHAGIEEHYCDICEKTFKHLTKHKATDHSPKNVSKEYTCEMCSKTFDQQLELTSHLALMHTGLDATMPYTCDATMPYTCDFCTKQFSFEDNYNSHLKIHKRGKESVQCHLCQVWCISNRWLNVHMDNYCKKSDESAFSGVDNVSSINVDNVGSINVDNVRSINVDSGADIIEDIDTEMKDLSIKTPDWLTKVLNTTSTTVVVSKLKVEEFETTCEMCGCKFLLGNNNERSDKTSKHCDKCTRITVNKNTTSDENCAQNEDRENGLSNATLPSELPRARLDENVTKYDTIQTAAKENQVLTHDLKDKRAAPDTESSIKMPDVTSNKLATNTKSTKSEAKNRKSDITKTPETVDDANCVDIVDNHTPQESGEHILNKTEAAVKRNKSNKSADDKRNVKTKRAKKPGPVSTRATRKRQLETHQSSNVEPKYRDCKNVDLPDMVASENKTTGGPDETKSAMAVELYETTGDHDIDVHSNFEYVECVGGSTKVKNTSTTGKNISTTGKNSSTTGNASTTGKNASTDKNNASITLTDKNALTTDQHILTTDKNASTTGKHISTTDKNALTTDNDASSLDETVGSGDDTPQLDQGPALKPGTVSEILPKLPKVHVVLRRSAGKWQLANIPDQSSAHNLESDLNKDVTSKDSSPTTRKDKSTERSGQGDTNKAEKGIEVEYNEMTPGSGNAITPLAVTPVKELVESVAKSPRRSVVTTSSGDHIIKLDDIEPEIKTELTYEISTIWPTVRVLLHRLNPIVLNTCKTCRREFVNVTQQPRARKTNSFCADCKLDMTASPKRDTTASPRRNVITKSKLDTATSPKLDIATISKLDKPISPELDTATRSKLDTTAKPKRDVPTKSKLDTAICPKRDVPTKSKLNKPTSPELDKSTNPNLDITASSDHDITANSKLDIPTSPKLDTAASSKRHLATKKSKPDTSVSPERDTTTTRPKRNLAASPRRVTTTNYKRDMTSRYKHDMSTRSKHDISDSPKRDMNASQMRIIPSSSKLNVSSPAKRDMSTRSKSDTTVSPQSDIPIGSKRDLSTTPKRGLPARAKHETTATLRRDTIASPKRNAIASPRRDMNTRSKRDMSTSSQHKTISSPKRITIASPRRNMSTSPKRYKREMTTRYQRDMSLRSKRDMATSSKPDTTVNSKREMRTSPKPNMSTSPKPAARRSKRDATTNSKRDISSSPKRDMTSHPKRDLTTRSKREVTASSKRDMPACPQRDSPDRSKSDISASPKRDVTPRSKRNISASPQRDITASPEPVLDVDSGGFVDAQISDNSCVSPTEIIAKQDVEYTPIRRTPASETPAHFVDVTIALDRLDSLDISVCETCNKEFIQVYQDENVQGLNCRDCTGIITVSDTAKRNDDTIQGAAENVMGSRHCEPEICSEQIATRAKGPEKAFGEQFSDTISYGDRLLKPHQTEPAVKTGSTDDKVTKMATVNVILERLDSNAVSTCETCNKTFVNPTQPVSSGSQRSISKCVDCKYDTNISPDVSEDDSVDMGDDLISDNSRIPSAPTTAAPALRPDLTFSTRSKLPRVNVREAIDSNAIAPSGTLDPNSSTPSETLDPNSSTPSETLDPNSSPPSETLDLNSNTPSETLDSNSSTPSETVDPNSSTPSETLAPNSSTPSETLDPNSSTPSETPDPNTSTTDLTDTTKPLPDLISSVLAQLPNAVVVVERLDPNTISTCELCDKQFVNLTQVASGKELATKCGGCEWYFSTVESGFVEIFDGQMSYIEIV